MPTPSALNHSFKLKLPDAALRSQNDTVIEEQELLAKGRYGAVLSVCMDSQTILQQRQESLQLVESDYAAQVAWYQKEYEAKKTGISMKADHDLEVVSSTIEQSKQHSLFSLDHQHQLRMFEIDQRALEQRLRIVSSANRLIMQAQQQKLERDMNDKRIVLQNKYPSLSMPKCVPDHSLNSGDSAAELKDTQRELNTPTEPFPYNPSPELFGSIHWSSDLPG